MVASPSTPSAEQRFQAFDNLRRVTISDCFDTSRTAFAIIIRRAVIGKQNLQVLATQLPQPGRLRLRTLTKNLIVKTNTSVNTLVDILQEFSKTPGFLGDGEVDTDQLNVITQGFIEAREHLFDAINTAVHTQGCLDLRSRYTTDYRAKQQGLQANAIDTATTIITVVLDMVLAWHPPHDFISYPVAELLYSSASTNRLTSDERMAKLIVMWHRTCEVIWPEEVADAGVTWCG